MSEAIGSSISNEELSAQSNGQSESVSLNSGGLKPVNQQMAIGMLAVFVAALITFFALHWQYPWFKVSSEFDIGMGASNEARMKLLDQMQIVANQNGCALLALGGLFLGTALSLVAPGCCNVLTRILAGVTFGLVWGGIVGYLSSISYTLFVPRGTLPSVTGMVGSHALTFGLLGLGLGALYGGYSKSTQAIVSSLLAGLLGGAIGGLLFAVLVGFIGETQKGTELVPTGMIAQAMWILLPSLGLGWCILQPPKKATAA